MSGAPNQGPAILAPASSGEASQMLGSFEPGQNVRIKGESPAPDVGLATIVCANLHGYEHSPADQTLVAATGERLGAIEGMLAEHGQRIPAFPLTARERNMTLGAWLASGADTAAAQRYGRFRESMIGAEFILADGTRAHSGGRVIKNVAGYDLAKLMAGSLGALAFVTAASLRLYPLPRRAARVTVEAEIPRAVALVDQAHRAGIELATCEWGGGQLEIGVEGPSAAVEAALRKIADLLDRTVGQLELSESDQGSPALASRLAEERESFAGTIVKVGTRLSGVAGLHEAIVSRGLAERGVRLHSHLAVGIHYLGVPAGDGLDGEVDAILRSMRLAGQRIAPAAPADGTIFLGRRPGGLATMRRLLDSFDPQGRLVSPMRTSIITETEMPG